LDGLLQLRLDGIDRGSHFCVVGVHHLFHRSL
jgi:hypothetical protein